MKEACERWLIELNRDAKDGRGFPVKLGPTDLTAESLRDALFNFLEPVDREACFISGFLPGSSVESEAAYWDNLALLARATAAALRVESEDKIPYGKKPMPPHQQRVVEEEKSLEEKIVKLTAFINGQVFATLQDEEKRLLQDQFKAMHQYHLILGLRIRRFDVLV
jgi:hypothetical protein